MILTYRILFRESIRARFNYINYIITQTDGSIIERFHYCYLPDGILTALGNPDEYWYDPYNIIINDDTPHDLSLSVNNGDVISGYYDLLIEWLGNGIVSKITLNVSGEPFGYSIQNFDPNPEGTYNIIFPSDMYYDGNYYFQAEVMFNNGESDTVETYITIDNSAPEWDDDGVKINEISQFSLIDAESGYIEVFSNGDLNIEVTAHDLHTNITEINYWLENQSGSILSSYYDTDLNTSSFEILIQDSLSTLEDGIYYAYLNITSKGGTISAQPMRIYLDTILPDGEFLTPDTSTVFGDEVITLEFTDEISYSDSLIAHYDMDGNPEYTQNYVPSGERTCSIPFILQSYHNGVYTYSQETDVYGRADVTNIGTVDLVGDAYADWGFSLDRDSVAGDVYMVSFDYYIVQGTSTPYLSSIYADGYKLPDSTSAAIKGNAEIIDLGDGWKRYTSSITITIGGDTWIRFGYGSNPVGTEIECYVDNFQIELNDHATPFADGIRYEGNEGTGEYTENIYPSMSPNYGWTQNYAATTTSISTTPYPMGLELYKPPEATAHATQGHWHGTWSNPLETFTTGEVYTVSFYARKTTENTRAFSINLRESDWAVVDVTTISASSSYTPTYAWQRIYRSFTVNEAVSAKVYVDWSYERDMTAQVCGFQVETKDHVTPFVEDIGYEAGYLYPEYTENIIATSGSNAYEEYSSNVYGYYGVDITSRVQGLWSATNNEVTFSFEGKCDPDGYPRGYVYFSDLSWSSNGGLSSKPTDWTYYELTNTMPDPTGKTVYFRMYHFSSGETGLSYSRKHQVEFNDHATPWADGIRYSMVQDFVGNSDAGLDHNSPEWISDGRIEGGSYSFNGANEFITTADDFSDLSTDYSISVWVKPGSSQVQYADILGNHGGTYQGFVIQQDSNDLNKYYFAYGDGTAWIESASIQLESDVWQNIAVVILDTQGHFYLDSVLMDTFTCANGMVPNTGQSLMIGRGYIGGGRNFNGEIDDVRIYNKGITYSEIYHLFQGNDPYSESPTDSVIYYIQTDSTLITNEEMTNNFGGAQDSLEFLGTAYVRYDIISKKSVYTLDYHQNDDHLGGSNKIFWVKLTDKAGNTQYIQTEDPNEISKYSFSLDDFNNVYYLDEISPITGTLNGFDPIVYSGDEDVEVVISADHDGVFLPIGIDSTFVDSDGTFSVSWDIDNLPANLLNSKVPVSYSKWSEGSEFTMTAQNFALVGDFRSNGPEIAFITKNPENKMILYSQTAGTVYDWTRELILEYSTIEALEGKVVDVDSDGQDEIILRTANEIILIDYIDGSFTETIYSYLSLETQFDIDLDKVNGFTFNEDQLYLSNQDKIQEFFFSYDDVLEVWDLNYVQDIDMPSTELISDLTYNTINNVPVLIIASEKKVLYYSFSSQNWISIFQTKYLLMGKIIVENLDTDPENEILFAVINGLGIDIVRADWDSSSEIWKLISTVSYDEISMIYDLGAGYLMNDNNGRVVVAHDEGIDIIETKYIESTEELTVSTSHVLDNIVRQNGLYEYTPIATNTDLVNWDERNGEIHYMGSAEYSIESNPVSYSALHFSSNDDVVNLKENNAGTITLSSDIKYVATNTYHSTGHVTFSFSDDLLSDVTYTLLLESTPSADPDDVCEVWVVDTDDDEHYQGDLEETGMIEYSYSGSIKSVKLVFTCSEDSQNNFIIDTISISKPLTIGAEAGLELSDIPHMISPSVISTGLSLSYLESLQTQTLDNGDLTISKILSPYSGGIASSTTLNTHTESYFDSLSDLGLSAPTKPIVGDGYFNTDNPSYQVGTGITGAFIRGNYLYSGSTLSDFEKYAENFIRKYFWLNY